MKDSNMSNDFFETEIIDIEPNKILIRGYPIEQLLGNISYTEMLLLEITGELPRRWHAKLLEAVLVGGSDHSLYAPSIAVARIAATCGITFNSCVATGMNILGDIHGGAGEQVMRLLYQIVQKTKTDKVDPVYEAVEYTRKSVKERVYIPGFGHGQHTKDPRIPRLFSIADEAQKDDEISGVYISMMMAMESELAKLKGRPIPINIDGCSAAIQCELGLPAEIAKGLFCLSRGIGLVAHAYEEYRKGGRLKSAIRPDAPIKYTGVGRRELTDRTR